MQAKTRRSPKTPGGIVKSGAKIIVAVGGRLATISSLFSKNKNFMRKTDLLHTHDKIVANAL
jgi:hypothetical protein